MNTQLTEASQEAKPGEHRKTVSITIDGKDYSISKGEHRVTELKRLGGVPADYELDQVLGHKFVHLPDDGTVRVHEHERFVSHPKDSSSS